MDVKALDLYRRIPTIPAVTLATLISACTAVGSAAVAAFVVGFLLEKLDGAPGPGGGVLVVCTVPNVAIPVFVSVLTIQVNWHHTTSWLTPTLAFALSAILTWLWIPFSFGFAPVVLGTGAIAWLISCWLLRKKGSPAPEHVV